MTALSRDFLLLFKKQVAVLDEHCLDKVFILAVDRHHVQKGVDSSFDYLV